MLELRKKKTYEDRFPVSTVYRKTTALNLEGGVTPEELQSQINNLNDTDFSNLESRSTFLARINTEQEKYIKTGGKTFPTAGQPPQPQKAIENKELPPVPTTAQQINNAISIAIKKVLGFKLLKSI